MIGSSIIAPASRQNVIFFNTNELALRLIRTVECAKFFMHDLVRRCARQRIDRHDFMNPKQWIEMLANRGLHRGFQAIVGRAVIENGVDNQPVGPTFARWNSDRRGFGNSWDEIDDPLNFH